MSALHVVRAVEVEHDLYRVEWSRLGPTTPDRFVTGAELERLKHRNTLARRLPFPVHPLEESVA